MGVGLSKDGTKLAVAGYKQLGVIDLSTGDVLANESLATGDGK